MGSIIFFPLSSALPHTNIPWNALQYHRATRWLRRGLRSLTRISSLLAMTHISNIQRITSFALNAEEHWDGATRSMQDVLASAQLVFQ